MATTIVNPPSSSPSNDSSGFGFLAGIVLLILVGTLFVYYGLPYIQQMTNKGVQINIPKDINVTVQQPK